MKFGVLINRDSFFFVMSERKIIIQGELGCFHHEAAFKFFGENDREFIPSNSFVELANQLDENPSERLAIMAIENSIAGSILQNYRILREHKFRVVGEIYLRIKHNLMALPGQRVEDIVEVRSHPMALNQCLAYLRDKQVNLIETEDTALSAKRIAQSQSKGIAAIASSRAAKIYGLDILAEGIETSLVNYTRFFIVQGGKESVEKIEANKASIYLRVPDGYGMLLKVLEVLNHYKISMTKLQSFPVLGELKRYYFHLDLEFDEMSQFEGSMKDLVVCTESLEVLGTYKKATIDD